MVKKKSTKTKSKPKALPPTERVTKMPPIQVQLDDHEARIAKLEANLK